MTPKRDPERSNRTKHAINAAGFQAIVCAHPKNVSLLAGYWPIIGNSLAICDVEGYTTLLVPEDEEHYARGANADSVISYKAKKSPLEDVHESLSGVLQKLDHPGWRIAIERQPISQEASYIGMTEYGFGISHLVREILPQCSLDSVDPILERERAILTTVEQERVRTAATIAGEAFVHGATALRPGMTEFEAAQEFERCLSTLAAKHPDVRRARGLVSCMSGEQSGTAYGAFALSSSREIREGELILTHCNSHADGFWTDVTRTYCIGEMTSRTTRMYEAMFAAAHEGIAQVKPGVRASEIDRAVREELSNRGFGDAFKHDTGHGVGYSAIDHNAIPRLKRSSPDILETGMVMNIEPGIYFEGFGGMRQCNMVLVTESGVEVLTPFQSSMTALHL